MEFNSAFKGLIYTKLKFGSWDDSSVSIRKTRHKFFDHELYKLLFLHKFCTHSVPSVSWSRIAAPKVISAYCHVSTCTTDDLLISIVDIPLPFQSRSTCLDPPLPAQNDLALYCSHYTGDLQEQAWNPNKNAGKGVPRNTSDSLSSIMIWILIFIFL